MSIADQVTKQIKGFLEHKETPDNEALRRLATRYQEHCTQANTRLGQVGALINKSMVSEALRLAATEPPLLELCAELNFVGADEWRDFCARQGWPAPEPIPAAAIALLTETSATGGALEPLLKEYRKAVRAGDTQRVVRQLRQIAKLDAKNKTWIEDLRQFEQKRLGEVQGLLQANAQKLSKEALLALLAELDAFPVANTEAGRLRKVATAALKEIYAGEAGAEGAKLIGELSAAYAAQDLARATSVLQQYETLQKAGNFQPTLRLQTQYDEAMEWLQQEQKQLADQKVYDETLATLTLELEMGYAEKVEERLGQLMRLGRSLPESVEQRAKALLKQHRLEKKRRLRLTMILTTVVLLLLGAGATFAFMHYQFQHEVAAAEAELAQLFKAHDRTGFEACLAALEDNKTKVFDTPTIQVWAARKAELRRLEEQVQATCQKTLARLDAVRQNGFREERSLISNLVAQAQACAPKGEDHNRIALFLAAWTAQQRKALAGKDTDARALLGQIGENLPGADAFAAQNPEELRKKIAAAQDLLAQAGKIEEASPELLQQLRAHKAKVGELAKGMEARQELIAAMATASSLYDYMEMLRKYVTVFPGDWLSKNFSRWLENETLYKEFSAVITLELSNRVWNATAGELVQRDKRLKEKWAEVQGAIASLGEDKELVDLYVASYLAEGGVRRQVFFKGKPHDLTTGVVGYGGLAYEPKTNDQQAIFKTLNKPRDAFEDTQGKLLPHCIWVKALIAEAGRTTSELSDLFLLNKMSELKEKNDIPALLRLRLISFLMDRFLDLSGSAEGSTWALLAGKLKGVDQDLSWLCTGSPAVQAAGQKATAILVESFSDSRQLGLYRAEWLLKRAAVDRTVQWVGFAPFKEGAPAVMTSKQATLEIWVVRPALTPDSFEIRVWEEQRGAERVHYEAALPGEPLFAPVATKSTRILLQEIKNTSGIADLNPASWKSIPWPSNLRR